MAENSNNIKKQGMTVREYVGENKSSYLVIKYKKDNTSEEAEYRKYFDELKNAGTIINASYDDGLWICFQDKDSPTKRLSFSFMEAHPEIEKTVKNYLLVKLYVQKCSLATVKKRLMHIRHFMEDIGFMNPDYVKDYQILIGTWNENKKREAVSIKEFLQFSSLDHAGQYYDVVRNIKKAENNYRELPNFQRILVFDYIVNDYWEKVKDSKDRYRLFPVILWWKLTTVIPTRPVEFFNLKRDSVYEKNGRYFFKRIAGIITGLFIFIIIVHTLNYIYVGFDGEWERVLWHSFYEDEGKIENLYLGSSHVYCDINPFQLDRLNGRYNFNLSTSAQRMNGTFYLLREADQRNELSHVYVELYYAISAGGKNFLDGGGNPIEGNVTSDWRNADYMRLSLNRFQYRITLAEPEKYPETFLGFTRYRTKLNDWKYVEATTERKRSGEYIDFVYQERDDNNEVLTEYQKKGRYFSARELTDRLYRHDVMLGEEPMAETSEAYLRKIITYCQTREIPITLFISPIYELQLISTKHYDFNLAKENCLPIQKAGYFMDVGHLNSTGAELYTEFFHQIMSGDAAENQKYFYPTYAQKLAHAAPEVYGVYYRDGKSCRNMVIASNREEGMEYRIVMDPDDKEPYVLQDFSENRMFRVKYGEQGNCMIAYRMADSPDKVGTIEITY